MMTRKHFKAIAEILGKAKAKALKDNTNNKAYECYAVLESDFITLLGQENPRFNLVTFQATINVKCDKCIRK